MVCAFLLGAFGVLATGASPDLRFLDPSPSAFALATARQVEQRLPKTSCALNTVFLDWGSSGIKVNPVHKKIADARVDGTVEEFKVGHLGPDAPKDDLLGLLGEIKSRLAERHAGGGAMATAGFRLRPAAAAQTWQSVQAWNMERGLFARCGDDDDTGCRTLPGAKEAEYETVATREAASSLGLSDAEDHFGMVSCGGASLQLGLWGGSTHANAKQCVADLGEMSNKYDTQRTRFSKKTNSVFVSFLSNHNVELHPESGGYDDYEIGGVNEMRAEFDGWLIAENKTHNPCLSSNATKYKAQHPVCDLFIGTGIPCLVDSWGAYMTHLEGTEEPTVQDCNNAVRSFMDADLMLEDLRHSKACMEDIKNLKQWFLLTAFSREGQLGADVSSSTAFSDLVRRAEADRRFETDEDGSSGHVGVALTSTLLVTFLQRLGVSSEAHVIASKAEVATFAMAELGLERGWVGDGDCITASTSADPLAAAFDRATSTPAAKAPSTTATAAATGPQQETGPPAPTTAATAASKAASAATSTAATAVSTAAPAATSAAAVQHTSSASLRTETAAAASSMPEGGGGNNALKALSVSMGLVAAAFMVLCFFQKIRPPGSGPATPAAE